MKLCYRKYELPEAQEEADKAIADIMKDLHLFINGKIEIRMNWQDGALGTITPMADLIVNGEVAKSDLLDLLLIDLYHLEMKVMLQQGLIFS